MKRVITIIQPDNRAIKRKLNFHVFQCNHIGKKISSTKNRWSTAGSSFQRFLDTLLPTPAHKIPGNEEQIISSDERTPV